MLYLTMSNVIPDYEQCYTLIVLLPCNMSTALCTWILNWVPSACKLFWTPHYEHCYTLIVLLPCNMSTALCTWMLNWFLSVCKLFNSSLWAILHWFFVYPVIWPLLYVHGCWIGFFQSVSYLTPHYEHCYTLIVLLPCNMSTALCTWMLNWVLSACKLFWSLWALLHTDRSFTLCYVHCSIYMDPYFMSLNLFLSACKLLWTTSLFS